MQLKAIIKNMARSKNISAQIVLQNYMLERLLERISSSRYKSKFILKGGFLIASIVGLDTRTTMDMDATIKGLKVNAESISNMLNEVCTIEINDDVVFLLRRIEEIRENSDYHGYRVALEATYPPIKVPLKVDITTGDIITPKEIDYEFKLLFGSRSIRILAYNLETIMAEKLETTITRGNQNTRPRDFYDIYIIRKLQWQNIDPRTLKEALLNTCQSRGTTHIIKRYDEIMETVQTSNAMNESWKDYQNQFDYARDIGFNHICHTIRGILDDILE
ncbi:abortive phage infection protein [Mesotoga sp. TolDC]|nr:abortive phage infection protein [Mesotoga sp. TolDC]